MTLKGNSTSYGKLARIIHWTTATLVIIIIPLGLFLANFDGDKPVLIYRLHIVFGILVFVLTLVRIFWAFKDVRPASKDDITGVQLKLFNWNHYILYGLLILMGTSGIAILLGSDINAYLSGDISSTNYAGLVQTASHRVFGFTLIAFFAMHVFGVLRHHFFTSDVLSRMGLNISGKKSE